MSRYPWQTAWIYVSSSVLDLEELTTALTGLEPDELRVALNGVSYATWDSRLPPTEPVVEHLRGLWETATEVFPVLAKIAPDSIECGVSIMQRMSPTDEVGPGFHIESRWVKAVADVGGEIDVDLYVDYPRD